MSKTKENMNKKKKTNDKNDVLYAETVCSPEFGCMESGVDEKVDEGSKKVLFSETVCSPEFGCMDTEEGLTSTCATDDEEG